MRAKRDGAYLLYDGLLYLAALLLVPWVLLRFALSGSFRRSFAGRLGYGPPMAPAPGRVLVHGVSVGEVRAARPLVSLLAAEHPECEIVVCSTTSSGRETARRTFPTLPVVAYPVDLPFACRRMLAKVKPTAVVLLELEIWPNFLRACTRAGIPVAIVNGRITDRSMSGYKRVQRLLPQFDRIRLYGVQNELYAERFRQLAVPRGAIRVTGNLKYDSLPDPSDEQAYLRSPWPAWIAERPAVALGSTHPDEEVQLLRAAAGVPELQAALWLVVPRHPRRSERLHAQLQREARGRPVLRRSRLEEGAPLPDRAVLLVDSFGELEAVYRAAQAAFVGGSLVPHGGQNVLEAAALGRPACVGPHTENFAAEVEWLDAAGGLCRANDAAGLVELLAAWLRDPAAAAATGRAAHQALAARQGGARATLRALQETGLLATRTTAPSPAR